MMQQTAPDIRPVRDGDVARLVELTLAAFEPVFTSFQRLLGPEIYSRIWPDWRAGQQKAIETFCRDREKHRVWVADVNGVPVGLIVCDLNRQDRTAEVQFLAVDPAHQNQGIGTALNSLALERMRESGILLARVETGGDESHAPARRSYEKAGYAPLPLVRYFQNLTPGARPEPDARLARIPGALSGLLAGIAHDFPLLLRDNLVGIYLWGSLSYDAFDERCSDVDMIVLTRWDLNNTEFASLVRWFRESAARNPWTGRLDMRFVIDGEQLDKSSRCCGFYSGKLSRHGSDGNPIIWLNIRDSGITLRGRPARLAAPRIPERSLEEALLLELDYLKQDLARNAGDRSAKAFQHNAYAVLTGCRISILRSGERSSRNSGHMNGH